MKSRHSRTHSTLFVLASAAMAVICLLTTGVAQAQNTAPELYEPGAYRIHIGDPGFGWARYMDFDSAGNLYVADSHSGWVRKYDGAMWATFPDDTGSGSGTLVGAMGVVVDGAGRVYVSGNNVVKRFLSDGTSDGEWSGLGFSGPYGMALDGSDNLYVADSGNNRIQKFDGTTWTAFIADAGLDDPRDVAVDGEGNIYVADKETDLIRKYDASGTLLLSWDSCLGASIDQYNVSGVSIDGDGLLHLMHGGNADGIINVYDMSGNFQYE